jgi:hypothetical protein
MRIDSRFSTPWRIWLCGDATRAPGVVSKEMGGVLFERRSFLFLLKTDALNPGSLRAGPSFFFHFLFGLFSLITDSI